MTNSVKLLDYEDPNISSWRATALKTLVPTLSYTHTLMSSTDITAIQT